MSKTIESATPHRLVPIDRTSRARPLYGIVMILAFFLPLLASTACDDEQIVNDDEQFVATAMQAGVDALYSKHDPQTAASYFRQVLGKNPEHYGATYQLAKALDAAGKPDEARPQWEKVLAMAGKYKDTETANTAEQRLAGGGATDSQAAMMNAGIDALYNRHDPEAAVAQFRKVLEANPEHYGATYQLAAALEATGKSQEARGYWEKVLVMAETYKDEPTAASARTRLAAGK